MNYGVNYILVKSNWFDPNIKESVVSRMDAKGYLIYLTLFKFKLYSTNKNDNKFVTSINLLSKEVPGTTKLSKDDIYKYIRLLQRLRIINVTNISNWNSQLIKDGKINADHVLMIEAIDYPQTQSINEGNKLIDKPVTEDDYYIAIHAPSIHKLLFKLKLKPDYCVLFTLFHKYHRSTNGFYMSMEKMEHVTGIDKNKINRMIWDLSKRKYLAVYRKKNKKDSYYNEYYILSKLDDEKSHESFMKSHGERIETYVKQLDKKDKKKLKSDKKTGINQIPKANKDIESQIGISIDNDTRKPGFDTTKKQSEEMRGEVDRFYKELDDIFG